MTIEEAFRRRDRVEYVAERTADGCVERGYTGQVVEIDVEPGRVLVLWACGVHAVPAAHLRRQAVLPARQLARVTGDPAWALVRAALPALGSGRDRDPYWEQGSHPDVVERAWDELGAVVPAACRAQADGTPVLAHPASDRILAKAHGTQYALRLRPADYRRAVDGGAMTTTRWSDGTVTDLREVAGDGWIWGRWDNEHESAWLVRACDEAT